MARHTSHLPRCPRVRSLEYPVLLGPAKNNTYGMIHRCMRGAIVCNYKFAFDKEFCNGANLFALIKFRSRQGDTTVLYYRTHSNLRPLRL